MIFGKKTTKNATNVTINGTDATINGVKRAKTRQMAYCALFVALLCVLAQVAIPLPFSPVPLTLGLLGVLACGALLGEKLGVGAVAIYILMGLAGLPVFASFRATEAIVGVTGGFIIGYIPAALISGVASRFYKNKPLFFALLCVAVASCYLFGTAWYSIYARVSFLPALSICVFPFIPLDLVKITATFLLTIRLKSTKAF